LCEGVATIQSGLQSSCTPFKRPCERTVGQLTTSKIAAMAHACLTVITPAPTDVPVSQEETRTCGHVSNHHKHPHGPFLHTQSVHTSRSHPVKQATIWGAGLTLPKRARASVGERANEERVRSGDAPNAFAMSLAPMTKPNDSAETMPIVIIHALKHPRALANGCVWMRANAVTRQKHVSTFQNV